MRENWGPVEVKERECEKYGWIEGHENNFSKNLRWKEMGMRIPGDGMGRKVRGQ